MVYNSIVPLLYKHPKFELAGSWDCEIGLAQLWFPHDPVNTVSDIRWRKRERAVLNGLRNVALTATVELIPTNDFDVIVCGSDLPDGGQLSQSEDGKDALAIVSARIELPDDGYMLEDAPPADYYYADPITGAVLVPATNLLLHGDAAGPMPTCAELIARTYPLPLLTRAA